MRLHAVDLDVPVTLEVSMHGYTNARCTGPLGEWMSPPLPRVGAGEPLPVAMSVLKKAFALLVRDDGKLVGIVTRSDC